MVLKIVRAGTTPACGMSCSTIRWAAPKSPLSRWAVTSLRYVPCDGATFRLRIASRTREAPSVSPTRARTDTR
eukprot:184689-Prorocentrum_lima.AAC.1